jgi:dihydroorotate dehydrogenase
MLIRALHLLPPEEAHRAALFALRHGLIARQQAPRSARLRTSLLGHELSHPLGLAAGFDKNAEAVPGLFKLGFSFVEIGTLTPKPQAGNPKPRLFRLPDQQALINRMGFNNDGLEVVCARLEKLAPLPGPLGANIGANRDSADPIADYVAGLRALHPLVDYVTVNVSSPNTPGLRDLQRRNRLDDLLGALLEVRSALAGTGGTIKPLFLKVSPDLRPEDEEEIAEVALARGLDGLIVSNTTVARADIPPADHRDQPGGLSGPPLFRRSTEQLGRFFRLTGGRVTLIGAGGIATGADAYAKIRAGASALQLYTALIYQGPKLVARLLAELDGLLARDGYATIGAAVGADRTFS